MDTISILIPTYKRPAFIVEAINSCLTQDYLPYEIIIGDDSPDNLTEAAINTLEKNENIAVIYVHNTPSLGQVNNVNMLIDRATGSKIMLLHDDDLLVEGALGKLINCFRADDTISVAYGKQYIISNEGVISEKSTRDFNKDFYRTSEYEGSKLTSLEAGLVQQFPNNAYLIDARLAKQLKYNNNVGDVCDYDFGLRVGQTGKKLFYLNEFTAKYRLSAVSVSFKADNDAALSAYLIATKVAIPPQSIEKRNKWLRARSGVAIANAVANKKFKTAIDIYFSRHHLSKIITPGGIKRLTSIAILGLSLTLKRNSN